MAAWQLFKTLMRNRNAYALNREMIGFTVRHRMAPIQQEDALAFAAATRDNNPLYGQTDGPVPPFLMYKLTFPAIQALLCHRDLNLNLLRGVYADQHIVWHEPVMQNDRLDITVTIADIQETPVGEKIRATARATRNGLPVISSETGFIVRARKKAAPIAKTPRRHGRQLFETPMQTDKNQSLLFAKASGDFNFIHTSRILARLAGLKKPVLHGACVMAMSCAALCGKLLCGDTTRLTGMEGRFDKPVFPGDLLTLAAYETATRHSVSFSVYNASGDTVFKNGIFSYKR